MVCMLLGFIFFLFLVLNQPVSHSPDTDGDGISDIFQDIEEHRELVLVDGEWSDRIVGRSSEIELPSLLLAGSLLLFVIPSIVFVFIKSRPEREERTRVREEIGSMLDIVRRMASFLEIDPSLQEAVRKTQTSLSMKQQRILAPLLWEPMAEGRSFDHAYKDFSCRWEQRSPLIGRTLRSLGSASLEKDQEQISASVRKTMARFDKESREMITEYSRSLTAPSTGLFAIGVLLPLMLSTMIPLMGLSGSSMIMMFFLLWMIVPFGILFYGRSLVERRPMVRDQPFETFSKKGISSTGLVSLILGLFLLFMSLLVERGMVSFGFLKSISMDEMSITVLGVLLSFSFLSAGSISLLISEEDRNDIERDSISSYRLLRNLGTHLEERRSFESAYLRSLKAQDEINLPEPLPGDIDHISNLRPPFNELLGSATHFSRAGPIVGGRAVKALAGHLEEMHALEQDLASRIRSSIGQMGVTSTVFAPLMMGSSVGMFGLMDRSTSSSGGYLTSSMGSSMEMHQFLILSAGYLIMLSITTSLTLHRLERGSRKGGWDRVPKALILSSMSFSTSTIISTILIG